MLQTTIAGVTTRGRRVIFLTLMFVFFVGLCGALGPAPAHALTLDFDHMTGELKGASGVIVDDTRYNVTFRDGTCEDLFNGCDGNEDFPFSPEKAAVASRALLDQVFLDDITDPAFKFDSLPGLTRGCEGQQEFCDLVTPLTVSGARLEFAFTRNNGGSALDLCCMVESEPTALVDEIIATNDVTYALWSPSAGGTAVPEPGTILLLALGLVGLAAGARWRQRRAEGHQVG